MAAKFCKKCGKPIENGKKCPCHNNGAGITAKGRSFFTRLFGRMGIDVPSEKSLSFFENGQQIVPDIIKADEGEIPVRQYDDVLTLRSRVKGIYTKAKLQVTNKRVLLRVAGFSLTGPVAQQYEFAVDEIAGIEIKRNNRISPLNVLGALYVALVIGLTTRFGFNQLAEVAGVFGLIISTLAGVASVVPFFLLKKKFWLKFFILSGGLGALQGAGELLDFSIDPYLPLIDLNCNVADVLTALLLAVWFFNLMLVSFLPDIVFIIKTKGGTEAIHIRRKQHATIFKQPVEHSGFSEVLPGRDLDKVITEVGAIVSDIQTLGDMAIEKWKG